MKNRYNNTFLFPIAQVFAKIKVKIRIPKAYCLRIYAEKIRFFSTENTFTR